MKKNIAVVGCGHWGKNLVRNFSELDALYAICDPDTSVANKLAKDFSVKNLGFDEILDNKNIKGVVLAVPAPLHASMAIRAMNQGKDVYVEKPIALNEDEAKDMLSCSEKNNVKLMIGHLLQYHPVFIALKNLIQSNKLGNVKYIFSNRKSFGKVRTEEDVIWSFSPHDISMILSLTNEVPTKVRSDKSFILQHDIADIASINLEFSSGINARICVSWINPIKEQKITVIGDEGAAIFDDTKVWEEKLTYFKNKIGLDNGLPLLEKAEPDFIQVPQSEPLKDECHHFTEVVNKGIRPITDGEEGLKVLQVLSEASII